MSTGEHRQAAHSIVRNIRFVAFDFDGVFTDDRVYVMEDGREAVRCFRGDGIGLQKLARLGIETAIISTEANPVVTARAKKLNIRCIQDCSDKRAALETLIGELGISLEQTAFVGNDINDLSCLRCVGLPVIVSNAHSDIVQYAAYRTKTAGGHGAVREICDWIEQALRAPVIQSGSM